MLNIGLEVTLNSFSSFGFDIIFGAFDRTSYNEIFLIYLQKLLQTGPFKGSETSRGSSRFLLFKV